MMLCSCSLFKKKTEVPLDVNAYDVLQKMESKDFDIDEATAYMNGFVANYEEIVDDAMNNDQKALMELREDSADVQNLIQAVEKVKSNLTQDEGSELMRGFKKLKKLAQRAEPYLKPGAKKDETVSESASSSSQSRGPIRYITPTGNHLNLRTYPSLNADILTDYYGDNIHPHRGEHMTYLGDAGDFWHVNYDGYDCYVAKIYSKAVR